MLALLAAFHKTKLFKAAEVFRRLKIAVVICSAKN